LLADWRKLHATFRLRIGVDTVTVPTSAEADAQRRDAEAKAKREERDRERKEAAQRARAAAKAVDAIRIASPHWRETGQPAVPFEGISVRDIPYPILRLDNGEVITSWGARVPENAARRLLQNLPGILAMGFDAGAYVGDYRGVGANSEGLRIGCHRIPWAEVAAFCDFYGWRLPEGIPPADAAAG
jgi:hypothetical protein